MRTANIAQAWMALVGLVLVAAGLIGFLNTIPNLVLALPAGALLA